MTYANLPVTTPLLAIVGATGSGKNELAQEIAARFGVSLVAVDSRKIYRGLDIGTAKPDRLQRERFQYGMVDCVNPDEAYSAGRYTREARELVATRLGAGDRPILVGGTGFYLDAFIHGLAALPEIDPMVRAGVLAEAQLKGWDALHAELSEIDPPFAAQVNPHDKTRILRALEVYRQARRPLGALLSATPRDPAPWPVVVVWIDHPRPVLHARIAGRVRKMIAQGLVEEVRSILDSGFAESSPGLATVGYQEVIRHLRGELTLEETEALIVRNTCRYAKRQITWFRHRPYVHPIAAEPMVAEQVIKMWQPS